MLPHRSPLLTFGVLLCGCWEGFFPLEAHEPTLLQGAPVLRQIRRGEIHFYRLRLAASQYARISIDQHGIDLVVTVFGPDGKQRIEYDSCERGIEAISVLAETAGLYQLQVRPSPKDVASGPYRVWLATVRSVQPLDYRRDQAEKMLALGTQQTAQRTAASLQEAIKTLQEAASIWRNLGSRRGQALAAAKLSVTFQYLSSYEDAHKAALRALSLSQALRDPYGQANALRQLGTIAGHLGEPHKAIAYHRRARALWRSLGDLHGEAATLSNLGNCERQWGDVLRALAYHTQALQLRRNLGDRKGEASSLHNLGIVYVHRKEWKRALDQLHQALQIDQELGDQPAKVNTLSMIGEVYWRSGDQNRALEIFRSLVPMRHAMEDDDAEAYLHSLIASIERDRGNWEEARHEFEAQQRLLEAIRTRITDPNLRAGFYSMRYADYRGYLEFLMQQHDRDPSAGHDIAAFQTHDGLLGRGLREAIILRQRDNRRVEPGNLTVAEVQQQVLDDNTILLAYATSRNRSVLWRVTQTSFASYPLPAEKQIEDLVARVLRLLTARNQQVGNETADQRRTRLTQADQEFEVAVASLSHVVLGPVGPLPAGKRVLVVNQGALQGIPFSILPVPDDPEHRPLVVDHEVIHLPAVGVIPLLRHRMAEHPPLSNLVAVLADPIYDREDLRALRTVSRQSKSVGLRTSSLEPELLRAASVLRGSGLGPILPRLPFTRREAGVIAALSPPEQTRVLLGAEANRDAFLKGKLANCRIIHVAAHGLLNRQDPALSGLVLSLVDRGGRPQAGFLRLQDIYSLDLCADLIVLSACQTAMGKDLAGEGLMNLPRGFLYAGAARVVASLWKVDDEATAQLMTFFYEHLLGNERLPPAAALRAAQLAMRREPRWHSPYYWAAFQFEGEWR